MTAPERPASAGNVDVRARTAENVRLDPQPGDWWSDEEDGRDVIVASRDGDTIVGRYPATSGRGWEMPLSHWSSLEHDGTFHVGHYSREVRPGDKLTLLSTRGARWSTVHTLGAEVIRRTPTGQILTCSLRLYPDRLGILRNATFGVIAVRPTPAHAETHAAEAEARGFLHTFVAHAGRLPAGVAARTLRALLPILDGM